MSQTRYTNENLDRCQGDFADRKPRGQEERFSLTRLKRRVQAATDNANNLVKAREGLKERHANNEMLIKHVKSLNQRALEHNEQKKAECRRLEGEILGYEVEINYWKTMTETSGSTNAMERRLNTEISTQKKRLEIAKSRLLARERETIKDPKLIEEYEKLKEGLKIAEGTRNGLIGVLTYYTNKIKELENREPKANMPERDQHNNQATPTQRRPLRPLERELPSTRRFLPVPPSKPRAHGYARSSRFEDPLFSGQEELEEDEVFCRTETPIACPTAGTSMESVTELRSKGEASHLPAIPTKAKSKSGILELYKKIKKKISFF